MLRISLGALLLLTLTAVAARDRTPFELANDYIAIRGRGPTITSLQIDPHGRAKYDENYLLDMGFEGLRADKKTRAIASSSRVRVTDVIAEAATEIEIENRGVADMLEAGHTLGQSFTVDRGAFTRIEAHIPTWGTTDSAATFRLRRAGPGGEVVAERRIENARDNAWQELTFSPLGAGTYYLELAESKGQIGWWGSREPAYKGGRGYVDGRPAGDVERAIKVHGARHAGRGRVLFELDGPRLKITAEIRPAQGESIGHKPVLMRVKWDNTGHDVSARSVPFSRFFTDTYRYMPVQQLKRWKDRAGRYEHQFDSRRWIEADGTGNHDLRLLGNGLHLAWLLGDGETTLSLRPNPRHEGGLWRATMTIQARPREDNLPADWPRFVLPDDRAGDEATTFFYERAFTYGSTWGPGTWLEWNALGRAWHHGPHIDAITRMLATYPISEEGYVNTWGGAAGWPFPDNDKFDTRHFDTNARFILACWRCAAWTGDREFLGAQAERIRRAMDYQLDVLKGREGLIIAASKDVHGGHTGVGNNYWDILPFGHLDAFANAVWYASLEAMAQVEEMLAEAGGAQTDANTRPPGFYRALAVTARRAYNDTFWDDEKGRYIGCVDTDGERHDFGFTFVNLEAMAYGLADRKQVARIYRWMETEPTSTGKPDTYSAWIFAPRANTIHNPRWNPEEGSLDDVPQEPWWQYGWRGTPYGDQCQDGGAILYTSFFDLMARARHVSPDNAWQRWQAILRRWRMPDHLCGGPTLCRGEYPQQVHPGAVGLDIPFPESSLVPCWLVYGILGVEPTSRGLEIRPDLPASLPWIEVQNLGYRGLPLTVRATRARVTIACAAPGHEFTWQQDLDADGRALFTDPPASASFPDEPLWRHQGNWRAQWIWRADPEAKRACLRRSISLPAKPNAAWISITADNTFTLHVNGHEVGSGDNWNTLWRFDLARWLTAGENVIAIEATNAGGRGGVLAEGVIALPGDGEVTLATDRKWRITDAPVVGWMSAAFDDSSWPPATAYGSPPTGPWGDIGDPGPPL